MMRHYYAGHSYMGVNFTYASPCWTVFVFDSKRDRDAWVYEHMYRNGNIVAEPITREIAWRIAGLNNRGAIPAALPHGPDEILCDGRRDSAATPL